MRFAPLPYARCFRAAESACSAAIAGVSHVVGQRKRVQAVQVVGERGRWVLAQEPVAAGVGGTDLSFSMRPLASRWRAAVLLRLLFA